MRHSRHHPATSPHKDSPMTSATTTLAPISRELARRRLALLSFFFIPGISLASWVTRTPAVRDQLEASTAQMGLILFGLSIGSMAGILGSAPLVRRLGTKPVTLLGLLCIVGGVALIGGGVLLSSGIGAFIGLAVFGAGQGLAEIAMNVEGAEIERLSGRSFLPYLHGAFSLGTVVGASLGILFTAMDFPVALHLVIIAAICLLPIIWGIRYVPSGFGRQRDTTDTGSIATIYPVRRPLWKDHRLLLIGAIVLAMALAEGAANDWLPLLMVDGHGYDPAWGSLVFTGFALAMTIGRFTGGAVINRFGRVAVVRGSALAGAIGIALVVFVDNPVLAGIAVFFWGLGASLGFPLTISAAGDTGEPGEDPARRVSAVATTGYIAFLVGPPLLGFLGEHYGLRSAMIVVLAVVAVAIFLAPAVRPRADAEPTPAH
ncbi:MFS transporter [Mycetocola saprophilus]|uniref:MFS transporter n=1 Tax=Mycetocola saprophilus TaxID=76636 RepID=UPI00316ADC27